MKISKRLLSIANLIDEDSRVLDIGCNHALLGCFLFKKNVFVINSDICKLSIETAKKKALKEHLELEFRIGNGLNVISDSDNIDTVTISGLGSHTIIKILEEINSYDITNIIISSNNKSYEVRKFLSELNYAIVDEMLIKDNNKYYQIDKFKKSNKKIFYQEKEIFFGPILLHKKEPIFFEYYLKKIEDLNNIINNNKLNDKIKKELIEKLEKLRKEIN